jgi:glycosyltransferase involved in cell wall biosynthesis
MIKLVYTGLDMGTAKQKDLKNKPLALKGHRSLSLTVMMPVYNERHVVEASLRRLLALKSKLIREFQVVVVDDCSTDGTSEILVRLAQEDSRIKLIQHEENKGKGGALRTAIAHASGDVTVCHDADLEYDPEDIPNLLVPFLKEGADAVFGSRYMAAPYRRTLQYRHSLMNRMLTMASNWLTDLNLTDLETCYKAVRTPLLKSIPLRSNDFRIEVELAFKLAKRRARIFETPIKYMPRTYQEGKKIQARDGLLALLAMVKYSVVDDMYQHDEYGSRILTEMERAHEFNEWMGDAIRPYLGNRVLEIGSGIGTLTNQFIPRDRYLASDINPHYLSFLRAYAVGKPYLEVRHLDVTDEKDFIGLDQGFDTAIIVNVLEHVPDELAALRHLYNALEEGGRIIVLVPNGPELYGSLDEALDHRERYDRAHLERSLIAAGFDVDRIFDFNRFSVPGWWLNGKVLKRRTFSRLQIKIVNTITPLMKRFDGLLPWSGQSLIAVAKK